MVYSLMFALFLLAAAQSSQSQYVTHIANVTTLAGATAGLTDGSSKVAKFNVPYAVALDRFFNLYVADTSNDRIRKVTPRGDVSTLAGSPGYKDGTGTLAQFRSPRGVAVDMNDFIYVADYHNHRIRKVSPLGVVTTFVGSGVSSFADGLGTLAEFSGPTGISVTRSSPINVYVYIGDYYNNCIRVVSPAGSVSTLAGTCKAVGAFADGTGEDARFYRPTGVALNANNKFLYVAEYGNSIRKVATDNGATTSFVGSTQSFYADGQGTDARFRNPTGVAVDLLGNVYIADRGNNRIRLASPTGMVSTLAGNGNFDPFSDGIGTQVSFDSPFGLAVDPRGVVYVADTDNSRIRKVNVSFTCPAGVACALTDTPLSPCPLGFFCPKGSIPIPCPVVRFCVFSSI